MRWTSVKPEFQGSTCLIMYFDFQALKLVGVLGSIDRTQVACVCVSLCVCICVVVCNCVCVLVEILGSEPFSPWFDGKPIGKLQLV